MTHWLFSYPVICPLLYVHGYWICFLQDVSYFELPHWALLHTDCSLTLTALCTWLLNLLPSGCKLFWTTSLSIVTHWLLSYPVICPLLYVRGYWIWFLQWVGYFKQHHYEHCYTLIVLLLCNMSTALCTWILNLFPSGSKLFWTTSLWALLHTYCSNMSTAMYMATEFASFRL